MAFKIYNSLQASNGLPAEWPTGFKDINLIKQPDTHINGVINVAGIQANLDYSMLNYFDVEDIWDDDAIMNQLFADIDANFPELEWGFYSHAPTRYIDIPEWMDDYRAADPGKPLRDIFNDIPAAEVVIGYAIDPEGPKERHTIMWLARVTLQLPAANSGKYYFPSLYCFDGGAAGYDDWIRYAKENIKIIRDEYPEKPIYPFIWPDIYNDRDNQVDYWQEVMDFCRKYTDGAIIWSISTHIWDDNAPWWLITQQFIEESTMARPIVIDSDSAITAAGTTSPTLSSFTVSANANTLIMVASKDDPPLSNQYTACTFDGNAATQLLLPSSIVGTNGRSAVVYFIDVSDFTGTGDIVFTQPSRPNNIVAAFTTDGYIVGASLNGCVSNAPFDIWADSSDGANTLLAALYVHDTNTSATVTSGQTVITNDTVSTYLAQLVSQDGVGGQTELSWSVSSSAAYSIYSMGIRQEAPPISFSSKTITLAGIDPDNKIRDSFGNIIASKTYTRGFLVSDAKQTDRAEFSSVTISDGDITSADGSSYGNIFGVDAALTLLDESGSLAAVAYNAQLNS